MGLWHWIPLAIQDLNFLLPSLPLSSLSMLLGVEGGLMGQLFSSCFFNASSFLIILLKPGSMVSYLAFLALVKK